ncbi:hypothetical protein GP486_006803 [Trichoglossum hirsutum]|uniref:Uncharacterized protein n=1 Tax=Trichoglossum hirsutum TaxID=265104 RepID=A0A9P8IIU4_9PEZI|nr:hypothetical protein GP486_006803 [Trichoglossum hirsutum]
MLATYVFGLALLPAFALAQVFTVTLAGTTHVFTLPPFGAGPSGTNTAAATAATTATATATVTATATAGASTKATTGSGFSTITVSLPSGSAATFVLPPFVNANATSTVKPFTGAASNLKNSGLAVAFACLAVLGVMYG